MISKAISFFLKNLRRIHHILIWLMCAWFAHSMIKNGIFKLDEAGFWTNAFREWGYPDWFRILVGILEIAGGVLILIPRLRHLGGILLSFIMLGALITRLIFGTGYEDVIYLLLAIYSFLFFASYSSESYKVKKAGVWD